MRRPALLLLTLVSLLGTLLAAPASAAGVVYEVHHVESVDGALIRVEIQRDTRHDSDGGQPVILTYSPYNSIRETKPANDGVWRDFGQRGYARAVADVIGTRGSTGCWDYGGEDETQSGVDVVNYLSNLGWSNGNVAMMGGSYDGTTATMVASRGDEVPGLKAIVPVVAISRWYGYSYQDGVRFFLNSFSPTDEGFDTPLAFDFGFGRTVAADPTDEHFAATAQARTGECESIDHTEHAYSSSPDYDEFWYERDYIMADADTPREFRAAALIAHGWQDFNVKQVEAINLYEAYPIDDPDTAEIEGAPFKLMFMGQGRHGTPSEQEYKTLLQDFLAQTLYGEDRGLPGDTEVWTRSRDYDGPRTVLHQEGSWPPAGTETTTLHLGRVFDYDVDLPVQEGLIGSTGETGVMTAEEQNTGPWTWIDTGHASELIVERDPLNEPGHGYYSLFWQTQPLDEDVRVAGSIELEAKVAAANAAGAHLTPVVLDIAPDGETKVMARGFLNLDYRDGLAEAKPAPNGEYVDATVSMLPQDYTFKAGHRIGLLTMSTNTIWAVPGNRAGLVNIHTGDDEADIEGSKLHLPIVGDVDAEDLFGDDEDDDDDDGDDRAAATSTARLGGRPGGVLA